jgi:hypothetical protein
MPRQQSFIEVWTQTFPYIALEMSGDVGPFTTYTNKHGRIVYYPRSPPTAPPTTLQLNQRQKFRDVATNWKNLTQAKRDAWNRVQYSAHLSITGYNLFTWWTLDPTAGDAIKTIARQTGENIP